jgi:polar amino acid transport system substrate-binding protein
VSRTGLVAVLLAAGAACSDVRDVAERQFDSGTPGKLVVAAEVPDPGFWEGAVDEINGGFEYGLARALADEFDLGLEVIQVPFEDVIEGRLGTADLALQEVSVTPAREEHVEFSVPYLETSPTVVARRDGGDAAELTDLATAQEQRWAVRQATTEAAFIEDVIRPEEEPLVLPDNNEALRAVVEGRADAALLDLAAALVATDGSDVLVAVARFDKVEPIAAVLPAGSDNVTVLDQAIRRLLSDGTIEDLTEQWLEPRFSEDPDDLPVILTS